jgi:hypothetical protein
MHNQAARNPDGLFLSVAPVKNWFQVSVFRCQALKDSALMTEDGW